MLPQNEYRYNNNTGKPKINVPKKGKIKSFELKCIADL